MTIKLKYRQYNRTHDDPDTIRMYVAKGEPMAEKYIFVDRDAMKYDYQITWHHKEEGRMEQGWVRGVSDGYIYCVIPDDLRTRIMRTLEEKVEEVIEDVIDE